MSETRELNDTERNWIKSLLSVDFKGRNIIKQQIEKAKITSFYEEGFISLKFLINDKVTLFPYNIRVPVELHGVREGKPPIVFMLHIINGLIDELEIFNADSSRINNDIEFNKFDIIINEKLKI